jgi:hypothetical protein
MDLYLEPPWAFINYVTHVTWTVTFVDELPEDERSPPSPPHIEDEDDPTEGAAT